MAPALRSDDLGEIPAFIWIFFCFGLCFFIDAASLQLNRNALKASQGNDKLESMGCVCPPWDLHLLHPLGLQAGPIPWT